MIDAQPEERSARGLAELFHGRVYLARYGKLPKQSMDIDIDNAVVTVTREVACDSTVQVMRSLRNLLPEDLPRGYVEQMISPRRVVQRDEYGRHDARYRSIGPDDYFHAEVYDLLATEVAKYRQCLDELTVRDGELVVLPDMLGIRPSNLADYEDVEYSAGPPEPNWEDFAYGGTEFDY